MVLRRVPTLDGDDLVPETLLPKIQRLSARDGGFREVWANDPHFGTPGTRAAFVAALDAAEDLGLHTIVRIPPGMTVDVGAGLSMSGRSAQIVGAGAGWDGTAATGSVIEASTQTGPVLDYTGYVHPLYFWGRVTPLAGVAVMGSGAADPTKANSGLKCGSLSSVLFRDLIIGKTGGPCINLAENPGDAFYLSTMERITLLPPVSAQANDVPWFYANECNGNLFRDVLLRSLIGAGDVGVSGAVLIEGNATYAPYENDFERWRCEKLYVPTGGTIFSHSGNTSRIIDLQFHDCAKISGATGTSFVRLKAPTVQDYGGNLYEGVLHGDGDSPINIDAGVEVFQSRNHLHGPRGYGYNNVVLKSGCDYTTVVTAGQQSGGTWSGPAVTDGSSSTHNTVIDHTVAAEIRGRAVTRTATAGSVEDNFVTSTSQYLLRSGTLSDANFRVMIRADGLFQWGNGTGVVDTDLYRAAAGVLATDGGLTVAGTLKHTGAGLGFYNATAVAKPAVTGSRGGNAALASLLTALATLGLITDSSS